ncbi:mycothiol transferase [Glycomyces terrestris]|uniref:DUF664 domain-containing protein n=1 Tax=Glycomyces terrestris TaxID=2493553 RepID=A0A426UWF0_9ACTN|nr:DUF664 domain-containing protein [Glycomyces terrestris]RRR98642.1 DUF664 domain-containing protein [Glycomyces terrestris]
MEINELLADAFGRVLEDVRAVADGLAQEDLDARPGPEANSIAWLVWHIARVQDDHVSEVAGREQVWTADGWAERFGLPLREGDIGYGHTSEQAGEVKGVPGAELVAYYEAVHAQTLAYVAGLTAPDLDRIVDRNWTPHVTLGVRLVSVVNDNQQHVGQAAYVRGLLERG